MKTFSSICITWYAAAAAICLFILCTPFDINTYVDAVAFAVGCVMIGCCGNRKEMFDKAFYVIIAFALYFAATIWIQVLMPEFYSGFVTILPERFMWFILKLEWAGDGYTGFTINPGLRRPI